MNEALHRLARAYGIGLAYVDAWGRERRVGEEALRAVLGAMHVDAHDDAAVTRALDQFEQARFRQCLAPMSVVRRGMRPWKIAVNLPSRLAAQALAWRVRVEEGAEISAAIEGAAAQAGVASGAPCLSLELALDVPLPCGYHALELCADGTIVAAAMLAVAPDACHRPPALHQGGRAWGFAVQLYGLRSARNFGIGDFTDLAEFVALCAAQGADVVGVNPLHALFPHAPKHASPYSPSSRMFVNVLYLDVLAIPEFSHCAPAREYVASEAFRAELARVRAAPLVDYAGVASLKLPVLALLYAQARDDARKGASERWVAFDAYKTERGEALRRQALFDALQAHFFASDPAIWGWPVWPAPYRDPASPAVAAFADEHVERVDYFAWLQWQADLQRETVAARARQAGLAIGLYSDLAVSIDRGGAEAWANQSLYATGASVGAPPDVFNVRGQDWGLPPMIPARLRDAAYAPFIATLRANMRSAGALRIDHVMGLLRLYWVPAGATPADGAYVHYPLDDLLGLLALESERHRCLVIGEDLGTVPDAVRAALAASDVLSYRVLLFERDANGVFNAPATYPEAALATASTHDLPTLAGWWAGHDIAVRAAHGHLGANADVDAAMAERIRDRGQLLAALAREELLPDGTPLDPDAVPAMTLALVEALHAFLARSPCALFVVQPEDVLGVVEQANLPGTTTEHPNWRRKLPVMLDDMETDGRLRRLAARVAHERATPS
ncbi:MAG TPA: 4-alpha-glucanotransferase [Casimicrobiaceae bacterium]|nr:4-alpha-glucanotransferase [Casimicrobiaceae bacterium]